MGTPDVFRRVLAAFWLAVLLAGLPAASGLALASLALAPASGVTITAIDTSVFPELAAFVSVNDASGARLPGLAGGFALREDGAPVRNPAVNEQDVGVQVVFVLDSTEAFNTRDANGITRLEHIQQALTDFARTTPWMKPGIDDVTVLAAEGPVIEHSSDSGLVAQAVAGYATSFAGAADPFPLLNRALDYALDVPPRSGMRRFVVFLSNGINQYNISGPVADLVARTAAGPVPIYTVFVGPAGAEATTGAQHLLNLAEATGGQRLLFDGAPSLTSFTTLFQLLSGQGRQYRLTYRSSLSTTGQHSLVARVTLPDGEMLTSAVTIFPLRVEAPQVRLQDVPASLVRVAPSFDADPARAEPTVYPVALMVDFPDGHPRALRQAQLVVDGQVVTSWADPADLRSLAWPLSAYANSQEHQLRARVIDELGLLAESEPVTVTVSLRLPAVVAGPAQAPRFAEGAPLLVVGGIGMGLALAIGLAAGVWNMRRQTAEADAAEATEGESRGGQGLNPPPITAPGREAQLAPPTRPRVAVPGLRWPGRPPPLPRPRGAGWLEVVRVNGDAARPNIELVGPHLTLGRDAALADVIFHDRSVARLHARVTVADGRVLIVDQGSAAGTWVNFSPAAGEAGCELQHGDLINLGRVQLRFYRHDAPASTGHGVRVVKLASHSPAGAGRPEQANGSTAPGIRAESPPGPTHIPVQSHASASAPAVGGLSDEAGL